MRWFAGGLLVLCSSLVSAGFDPTDVLGLYRTEGGSHVEIGDCGDQTPCGRIVWIDPDTLDSGKTPQSLQTRSTGEPVLGLLMLKGFTVSGNRWDSGTIYNPKTDKTYRASVWRLLNGDLSVRACVGLFCRTQVWQALIAQNVAAAAIIDAEGVQPGNTEKGDD